MTRPGTMKELLAENEELRARLDEAREALRAIRSGEVDALVGSTAAGERLPQLSSADRSCRQLIEAMTEGALTLARDGTIVYCNTAFGVMVKTPLEKVIGGTIRRFVAPGEQPAFEALFRAGLRASSRGEVALRRADESTVPVQLSFRALPLDEGCGALAMVAGDLSESKRAGAALRAANERLALALAGADLGCYEVDMITSQATVDSRYLEMLGYAPGEVEITRKVLESWMHPDDVERVGTAYARHLAGSSGFFSLEYRIRHRDGRWVWILDRGRAVTRDPGGRPLKVVGTHLDTTGQREAEAALRESEERYHRIFSTMQEGIWQVDADYCTSLVNPAMAAMLGLEPDEMLGRSPLEFLPKEDHALAGTRMTERKLGAVGRHQVRVRHRDGTLRWFDTTANPILDAAGRFVGSFAVFTDITERVTAEEALRESESRFRSIFENSLDGMMLTAPDGRILAANHQACRMLGRTEDELCQVGRAGIVDEDDPRLAELLKERALTGRCQGELNHLRRDGTRFPAEVSSAVFVDRHGAACASMSIRDITERKRAEAALRMANERLELALDGAGLGVYEGDIRTGRSRLDSRYLAMLGYHLGELDLSWERFQDLIHPGDRAAAVTAFQAHLAGEKPMFSAEYRMRHRDGRWVWVLDKGRVTERDPSGRPLRILGLHLDISDRKAIELEREHLLARIRGLAAESAGREEALRLSLARELHDRAGQDLSALALSLDIVRSRLGPEAPLDLGARLDDAGALVSEIIQQLREVTAELRPPLLDEVGLLAALRWLAEQFTRRTGVGCTIEGSETPVRARPEVEIALFRVTQEALINAAKHAAPSIVVVAVEDLGAELALRVEDDGCGFDPNGVRPPGPGGGWGLLGMRERIEAVGGHLTVESRPGTGTTLRVAVPR